MMPDEPPNDPWGILSFHDKSAVVLSVSLSRGGADVSEHDVRLVQEWAENAKWNAVALDGVLNGTVDLDVVDGKLEFYPNAGRRTEESLRRSRELLRQVRAGKVTERQIIPFPGLPRKRTP